MPRKTTRRSFLRSVVSTSAAVSIPAPAILRGEGSPSQKVNIGGIGVGGKGAGDIQSVSKGQNVVAICDVDLGRLRNAQGRYPDAQAYADWRKLLEQKDIDAVTVSTPDHMHAPIAMSAMALGKHVYVQKPLAHDIYEARQMRLRAAEKDVVTQMGNQGHSSREYRQVVEVVRSGAIGKIKEAHAWSNRPIWPQGMESPPGDTSEPPPDLRWNLWLGVAPERPYANKKYHPFNWRGWVDFGTGALGDMGCHILDPIVWSIALRAPRNVSSESPGCTPQSYPRHSRVRYEFDATPYTVDEGISVTWHDGGKLPPRDGVELSDEEFPPNGSLYIGEKGILLARHSGKNWLFPATQYKDYAWPRIDSKDHYMEWTRAILGETETTSHFDYAGPLTETVLLGNLAIRFPGETLQWDSEALRVTNKSEASQYVRHTYREGWEVAGL